MKPCPCEGCKGARDLARQRRVSKRAAENHRNRRLQAIEGRIEASKDAVWPSSDGPVRVQGMNSAHLFYAIAKGYRGEYPLRPQLQLHHLENEALRRLVMEVR